MKAYKHALASLVIGAAVGVYFRSFVCGAVSFLTGVFIDIDHIFDCYMNYGRHFRMGDIFKLCYEMDFKNLTLVFHSYELILLLWIAILALSLNNVWKAAAIGMSQHLLFDFITNRGLRKRSYFLTYRLANRFSKECLLR